jgi:hypothetical protein
MTDQHARALRGYREHHTNAGAGGGRKARDFQRAARAAMDKAKGAVPVWVVPLPNLLENIPAQPNTFDVIIVDEASQVGLCGSALMRTVFSRMPSANQPQRHGHR